MPKFPKNKRNLNGSNEAKKWLKEILYSDFFEEAETLFKQGMNSNDIIPTLTTYSKFPQKGKSYIQSCIETREWLEKTLLKKLKNKH